MKKFIFTILAAITACIFVFAGCGEREREYGFYPSENSCTALYYSMHADATLVVYDGDTDGVRALADGVYDVLEDIDRALSVTVASSDISKFNAAQAGKKLEIGEIAYEVLSIAKSVYLLTEGHYNPAVYYGVEAFGFNGSYNFPETSDELPSTEATDAYAALASHFGDVELSSESGKYYVTKPDFTVTVEGHTLSMKIDLGGVGKGYAADRVNELMDDMGYEYAYFNFGSSSLALNKKPETGSYALGFNNPRRKSESDAAAYISTNVADECVSTSGDYENYFILDGVRYCHIFDPFTARPVDKGIMTATVIGGSAAEDDALTTAIMSMSPEEAVTFITEHLSDRRVAFTCDYDGFKYYTNMSEGTYNLLSNAYTLLAEDGNVA